MVTTHPSRISQNGDATTLYVTAHAEVVCDSHSPFEVDDEITVTTDRDRLIVTDNNEANK